MMLDSVDSHEQQKEIEKRKSSLLSWFELTIEKGDKKERDKGVRKKTFTVGK